MLRQRVKGNEADRFITARSVERDKKIEKYNIREDKILDDNYIKEGLNLNNNQSVERKIRTPTIVTDEKQYSRKLYLSLLKSQIFNIEGTSGKKNQENHSGGMSKRKKKYTEYISKLSGDKNESVNSGLKNLTSCESGLETIGSIGTIGTIAKKIDFSSFNTSNAENFYPNMRTTNKLNIENMPFTEENTKSAYTKLINFEIEDSEYTKNFMIQKRIPKSPYKILDAPNLKDDFYLHLLHWSTKDFLAVGLEKNLYIWESKNSTVNLLHTLDEEYLTSVCWTNEGDRLLVGTSGGKINVWDVEAQKCLTTYQNHNERIGVICNMNTNNNMFTSGSQDKMILNYDIRISPSQFPISKLLGHSQEVCGLKWSPNDRLLASGGNDNKLMLWNGNKMNLEKKFKSHSSAVKALDWSPHKYGCLITGGGTQDRTIKIWNTNTMKLTESIDTSSQVCNIAFSKNSHEFVTTHGYSDNLILVWNSDTLDVKASLKGHKDRVIYLSTGPDMQKIVTGAGDETIRFWDVFIPESSNSKRVRDGTERLEDKSIRQNNKSLGSNVLSNIQINNFNLR